MASGISFLAGLLTGAAAGVEQGKKIKLAKEENEIRRQQVEATKQLGFAQIAATGENQRASLALQEKLGLLGADIDRERIGLGREELGVRREESAAERNLRVLMQDSGFLHDLEMSGLGQKYGKELEQLRFDLNERGAEAGVGRNIRQAVGIAEGVSPIEEGSRARAREEELEQHRQRSEIDFEYEKKREAFKDTFEVAKEQRALENELAGTVMGMTFKGIELDEASVRAASGQFLAQAFAASKDPVQSAADAKKLIRDLSGDNAERRQRATNILNDYFDGVVKKDPSATFNAMKAFREEYKATTRPIGGGEPTGKKSLTKPTNYIEWAEQNPTKWNDTAKPVTGLTEEDIQLRVFSKPGLKDATIRAQKAQNPVMSSIPGLVPEGDAARMLADYLNDHPEILGDTATRAAKALEMITRERLAPRVDRGLPNVDFRRNPDGTATPVGPIKYAPRGEPSGGGRTPPPEPISLGPQMSTSGGPREGEIRRSGR